MVRRRVLRAEHAIRPDEYHAVLEYIQQELVALPMTDVIDLSNQKRPGSLAHEAFYHVQGLLLDYQARVFDALQDDILPRARDRIERWYADPSTAEWRGPTDYQL